MLCTRLLTSLCPFWLLVSHILFQIQTYCTLNFQNCPSCYYLANRYWELKLQGKEHRYQKSLIFNVYHSALRLWSLRQPCSFDSLMCALFFFGGKRSYSYLFKNVFLDITSPTVLEKWTFKEENTEPKCPWCLILFQSEFCLQSLLPYCSSVLFLCAMYS